MLRPRVGQKKPPRLGSTSCYGQTWARKSRQDSAVRFVTAKSWPERATETRQYDLLLPNVGQIVTAKSWPEKATKTRQYDLLRPRIGQKKPPRLGSTISYGQTWARKSHQDSAVRFVTAKSWPERATKTRQYDLLRPRVGQKQPPRLGSTTCYGQTWVRKSHQDSAVRFVTARKSHQDSAVRFVTAKSWPERATETRQYDLLRPTERAAETRQYDLLLPNVGQKEPKTRQYDLLRPRVGQKGLPRLGSTICYGQTWARKSHRRFVTAKSWPERTTKTRRCDLLRPRAGQKEPPRLGSTICYGQELARKSHQDSAVRFVTAKSWPERATKTRQYDLLRPRVRQKEPPRDLLRPGVGKKEPPRLGSTICCGQEFGHKKSHQDSAVRFVSAKSWPERATETRQYDLLRPNVCQKNPLRLGNTSCYGQELARKSHQDSTVLFVTAKSEPERATKTRQYDSLRPKVGQKERPRLGGAICYSQTWAKSGPERFGSTICYGQEWARKNQQDSAVPCVTAKSAPERAAKTRQYDLLWPRVGQKEPPRPGRQYVLLQPRVGQKEPPRFGNTICYGQEWEKRSHQDSAIHFVAAKTGLERATKTLKYD